MTQTGDDATIILAVEMIGNDAVVLGSIPVTGEGTYRISFTPWLQRTALGTGGL